QIIINFNRFDGNVRFAILRTLSCIEGRCNPLRPHHKAGEQSMALPYPFSLIPTEVLNLFNSGAWAWAAPAAACSKLGVSPGDITVFIFCLRHPERSGKRIAADEKKLIAEWKAIHKDVVTVVDLARSPAPPPTGTGPLWMCYARAEMTRWAGLGETDTK